MSQSSSPMPADARAELKDFLTTRRAKVQPQMVGLPVVGGRRRVPGLRREEVAMLAGVSVDYYTRLERGNAAGASDEVLEALASALLLDDAERQHLIDLARTVTPMGRIRRRRGRANSCTIRPDTQWLLDAMPMPAAVRNGSGDYVAANTMARALYHPMFVDPIPEVAAEHPSMARFIFLDPRAREFFPNWQTGAEDLVAMLRLRAGEDPTDPCLQALIGELSTRSREFSDLWARHDVRYVCRNEKVVNHPIVGEIHLCYESAAMATTPGMSMLVYGVEPGSASAEALRLLSSWAATELAPADTATAEPR
ncbi:MULTISPECIES: helix-turn-helix transcriptional regulator [unclassified Actinomyces]|uniref:helix-turn-helix domain-containing protein n=1 Tax=unclassified Actinomyces TaxID=2609248 RepID=UPI00137465A0|nr:MULTISPECIES: helix-turn-helix transcriptional regulator [unclassified Actinomyces]MBW3068455.1 helix-turn-helix transcriptional regulator [Actinomyces sp. 594]NDR53161.1 helix-turn-helix transcriptional regulator [Actinomyces sp. 565]QHO90335.1 transcriptional regulator [Actinomyces sp. 432]